MSLSCKNVEDYVTLYKDGVLSDDTAADISEHLAGCKECRGFYKAYDGMNTSVPVYDEESDEYEPEIAGFAAIAKKLRHKKIKVSLFTAAGVLTALAGTVIVTRMLFKKTK